jgi:hypothetical protein
MEYVSITIVAEELEVVWALTLLVCYVFNVLVDL